MANVKDKRVVSPLTDEQIKELASGVQKQGVNFFAQKFGVSSGRIRSAIASLRKAGLKVELPPRKGNTGRYKALVQQIKGQAGK